MADARVACIGTHRGVVGLGDQSVVVGAGEVEDARLLAVHALGLRIDGQRGRGGEVGRQADHGCVGEGLRFGKWKEYQQRVLILRRCSHITARPG